MLSQVAKSLRLRVTPRKMKVRSSANEYVQLQSVKHPFAVSWLSAQCKTARFPEGPCLSVAMKDASGGTNEMAWWSRPRNVVR